MNTRNAPARSAPGIPSEASSPVGCGTHRPRAAAPAGAHQRALARLASLATGAAVALFLGACSKTPEKTGAAATNTTADPTQNPIAAPVEYIGALGRAKQVAERTIDLTALNQGIQLFYASEGRYPKDLQELVKEGHLRQIPQPPQGSIIQYNPQTGQVRIVKSP
jgi:hypothetical protein